MTTTSTPIDSMERGRIVPFPAHDVCHPEAVARAVASLRPAVAAGDGAAMLVAIRRARAWWDGYPALNEATGEDGGAGHLVDGWSELMRAVAMAPARTLPALLAKAQLAEWHFAENGDKADWDGDLARTLAAGLADLAGREGR